MADRPRLLLTGAAGFIGAHTLEHVLRTTDWDIIAVDREDERGRVTQVLDGQPEWYRRVTFIIRDLARPTGPDVLGTADYVIAMAAGVDVADSLDHPERFIRNNVDIALSTFGYCRTACPRAVILVSTAEVYGPLGERDGACPEWSPVLPPSPYAASKAAQEAIAIAYWRSYGIPVTLVNTMNLFGERQDSRKYLPALVRAVTAGDEVIIYPGSRCWLHAEDLASALLFLFQAAAPVVYPASRPARYNVAGTTLSTDLFALQVADFLGMPLRSRRADGVVRPGYDRHYALDTGKITALGWQPRQALPDAIARTVSWTLAHPEWMRP